MIFLVLIICIFIALLALGLNVFLTQKRQERDFQLQELQQQAWERAQHARQEHAHHPYAQQQEEQLEQHNHVSLEAQPSSAASVEQPATPVNTQVPTLQTSQGEQRTTVLPEDYQATLARSRIERELARLPRVEDVPIVGKERVPGKLLGKWQPLHLPGADLRGQDLSYRYLARANLRNAELAHANLFMADLTGAYLMGADLSEVDLTGANLSSADLRNTLCNDTNFMVADLNNALLTGAQLQHARNLTEEQLHAARFLGNLANTAQSQAVSEVTQLALPAVPKPRLVETATPRTADQQVAQQEDVPAHAQPE